MRAKKYREQTHTPRTARGTAVSPSFLRSKSAPRYGDHEPQAPFILSSAGDRAGSPSPTRLGPAR